MSGWLTDLAMRGAGMSPPGKQLLAPRRRARFEPIAGLTYADDIATPAASTQGLDPTTVRAPEFPDAPRMASSAHAQPGAPSHPALANQVEPPELARSHTRGSPTPPVSDPARPDSAHPTARSEEPVNPSAPSGSERRGDRSAPDEPAVGEASDTPSTPIAPPPRPSAANGLQMLLHHLAADKPAADPIAARSVPAADDQQGLPIAPQAPGQPIAAPPSVTVSIDRIQVVVEAAPSPPGAPRSFIQPTGFARYDRLRRGAPR